MSRSRCRNLSLKPFPGPGPAGDFFSALGNNQSLNGTNKGDWLMEKPATTAGPINGMIARRWSPRAFDPEKPVTKGQITALCEAARWAPSCFGDEPWRYVVFDRGSDATAWEAALACLAEKNQRWARNAPLLFLAVAAEQFSRNGKPNRWGQYDTGAASENLCLQATAMGLATHQMGGFDADGARRRFAIPDEFTPMAMIAVGHPADVGTLDEEFRTAEQAERSRSPLQQRFFAGRWGAGMDT